MSRGSTLRRMACRANDIPYKSGKNKKSPLGQLTWAKSYTSINQKVTEFYKRMFSRKVI